MLKGMNSLLIWSGTPCNSSCTLSTVMGRLVLQFVQYNVIDIYGKEFLNDRKEGFTNSALLMAYLARFVKIR